MTAHIAPVVHIPELAELVSAFDEFRFEVLGRLSTIRSEIDNVRQIVTVSLQAEGRIMDQLSDISAAAAELGLDLDTAVAKLDELDAKADQLEQALIEAGVDPAARAAIVDDLRSQQQQIRDALNPDVPVPGPLDPPVDPEAPPA